MALQKALFAGDDPTPESVKRRRLMAEQLLAQGGGIEPLQHPLQAVAKILQSGAGVYQQRKADADYKAGMKTRNDALVGLLSGSSSAPSMFGAAPASSSASSTSTAPVSRQPETSAAPTSVRDGIASTASALGIDPVDLATAISYETAGTFDPTKAGPTTQWGQHRGLIQFGEPQAQKYGVDWNDPIGSQLGPNGAVAKYLLDTGVKPGMGLLDIYSAINAGGVGRYNRSDANNGGAPGTVADKVNQQMAGHRQKAMAMFADQQPVQVASLDPSAGMSGIRPYSGPGATIGGPEVVYDRQGMRAVDSGQYEREVRASRPRPENVVPYSGPGATTDVAPPQEFGPRMPLDMKLDAQREQLGINAIPLSPAPTASALSASPQAGGPQQALAAALTGGAPLQTPMQATAVNAPPAASLAPQPAPQQQQLAQALTGGMPAQGPTGGIDRAMIAKLLGNPWTEDMGQQLLGQVLEQQMQANDPMRQLQMQQLQLEIDQARNPRVEPVEVNGRLVNPQTGQVIADFSDPDTSVVNGSVVNTRTGEVIYQSPRDPVTLSQGNMLVDPTTGQPIANNPAAPEAPEIVERYNPETGQPEKMMFDAASGGYVPFGGPKAPSNSNGVTYTAPDGSIVQVGGSGKPLTEAQSKDTVFSTRAQGALGILDQYAPSLTSRPDRALEAVPFGFGREYQDTNFQLAQQAGNEFLQAILRKDTGAAITPDEQALYGKTFLPEPGDSPELLAQKQQSRARAVEAIKAGMPPAAIIAQELALRKSAAPTQTGAPAPAQAAPAAAEAGEYTQEEAQRITLENARRALAADPSRREEIIQKMQEAGFSTEGL